MSDWHEGLTEKQRRFVEAYSANGGRAGPAASEAGYKHGEQQGPRLLRNVQILEAIERLREDTTSEAIATREQRQTFWTRVMLGEEKVPVLSKEDGEVIEAPPEMKDRLKASELLGKSQGDFLERREVTGAGGGPVKVIWEEDGKDA